MAFDSSRVIRPQPFPEDLLCAICTGVLQDPVEGPCEHLACRNCLDDWLQRSDSKTCPTCRQTLLPNAVKQAHRVIRNQLETLEVSCDNAARGCRAVLTLGALRNHVLSCGKAIESCPNDDCASALLREDVPKHLEVCPHRIIPCDRCDSRIKHQDQEAHLQGACPAVKVRCQHNGGCGSMVPRGAMSSHVDAECMQGIMTWKEDPGLEKQAKHAHEWPGTDTESCACLTAAGEWGTPTQGLSMDPDPENGNEYEDEDEDEDEDEGDDGRVLRLLMASSSTNGNEGAVGGQHGPGSKGKGGGGHAEGKGGRGVTAKAGAGTSKGNKVKGKEQEMGRGGQGQGRRADARSLRVTGKAKKCRPFVPVLEAEIEEESLVHARGDAGYDELGVQLGGGRGEAEGLDEAEARRREARAAMERAEQRRRKAAEKAAEKAARWEARREAREEARAALAQEKARMHDKMARVEDGLARTRNLDPVADDTDLSRMRYKGAGASIDNTDLSRVTRDGKGPSIVDASYPTRCGPRPPEPEPGAIHGLLARNERLSSNEEALGRKWMAGGDSLDYASWHELAGELAGGGGASSRGPLARRRRELMELELSRVAAKEAAEAQAAADRRREFLLACAADADEEGWGDHVLSVLTVASAILAIGTVVVLFMALSLKASGGVLDPLASVWPSSSNLT